MILITLIYTIFSRIFIDHPFSMHKHESKCLKNALIILHMPIYFLEYL